MSTCDLPLHRCLRCAGKFDLNRFRLSGRASSIDEKMVPPASPPSLATAHGRRNAGWRMLQVSRCQRSGHWWMNGSLAGLSQVGGRVEKEGEGLAGPGERGQSAGQGGGSERVERWGICGTCTSSRLWCIAAVGHVCVVSLEISLLVDLCLVLGSRACQRVLGKEIIINSTPSAWTLIQILFRSLIVQSASLTSSPARSLLPSSSPLDTTTRYFDSLPPSLPHSSIHPSLPHSLPL
jgi:hypothetical protein